MDEDRETLDDECARSERYEATSDGTGEIDAIGRAVGLVVRDDKPFRALDEVERRDGHPWEHDVASDDGYVRGTDCAAARGSSNVRSTNA